MPINIPRGEIDPILEEIVTVLRPYEVDHPRAKIDLYRQNSVSVRVRIIDPDFAGKSRPERSQAAWAYLDRLTDEAQGDLSRVLLLTPEETQSSFANLEFDDPVPSEL